MTTHQECGLSPTEIERRINCQVGKQLYLRRKQLAVRQECLANELGVTFQQVQKYERGMNRITVGKLYLAARFLECSPAVFFAGIDDVDPTANAEALASRNVRLPSTVQQDIQELVTKCEREAMRRKDSC